MGRQLMAPLSECSDFRLVVVQRRWDGLFWSPLGKMQKLDRIKIRVPNDLYEILSCAPQSCTPNEHGFLFVGVATFHEMARRAV